MDKVEAAVSEIPNILRTQDRIVDQLKSIKVILFAMLVVPVMLILKVDGDQLLSFIKGIIPS